MQYETDKIKKLRQEVEFYKRQLNEVASGIIGLDYKIIEMGHEIRQMQKGFALIAGLNQFKPLPVLKKYTIILQKKLLYRCKWIYPWYCTRSRTCPDIFHPPISKEIPV